jgi:peptide/nickel transport system substrate-binding protein
MEYVMLADFGPLANPLARQAINLLFPSDQFVSSVMKGSLDAPNSVLPDLMLYAAPGTYTPKTDVAKAKALLQQAGVKPGTQLTYEFYTGHRKEPGLVLQNQLQQVGLKLNLVEKAYPAFVADISTPKPVSQRPDMAWWFWWPEYNSPSDFCFPILSEDATPKQNLFNGGYYINSTVNNAINKGFTESDPAKLTAMWRQAQTVMGSQDPPWLPLGQIIDTSYLRTDVKGYVANPVYVESYDFYALSRGSA